MISANGKIEREEAHVAASIGRRLFAGFSDAEFAEAIARRNALPSAADFASTLQNAIDNTTKQAIHGHLVAIPSADDDVAVPEQDLLKTIARNIGLSASGHGIDESAQPTACMAERFRI